MKSIAIDLDGVLAEYDGFKGIDIIGDPIPGAKEFVEKLSQKAYIIIHTCRVAGNVVEGEKFSDGLTVSQRVKIVRDWLTKHEIPFNEIFCRTGKPYAVAYVDDRAVVVNKRYTRSNFHGGYNRAYEECITLLKGKENE